MTHRTVCFVVFAFAAGCASPPPAPPPPGLPPEVAISVQHFAGSPTSGPLREAVPAVKPEESLAVEVTFLAFDQLPGEVLAPLGTRSRLIVPSRGGLPIVATNQLTAGARAGEIGGSEDLQSLTAAQGAQALAAAHLRGALFAGTTATFALADSSRPPAPPPEAVPEPRRVEVQVHRPAARIGPDGAATGDPAPLQLALVVEGPVPRKTHERSALSAPADAPPGTAPAAAAPTTPAGATPEAAAPPAAPATAATPGEPAPAGPGETPAASPPAAGSQPGPAGEPTYQRETVLLDPLPAADRVTHAILVPSPFGGGTARAIAAVIRIGPAPPPGAGEGEEHAQAAARAAADIERSAAIARERTAPPPPERPVWSGIESAVQGLIFPWTRRPALLYLAGASGASVAEDLAYSAPDDITARYVDVVIARCTAGDGAATPDAVRWLLEKSAFELLAETAAKETLPPEVEGILTRHAGEAGRGDAVGEVIAAAADAADFANRIVQENLIYLEDPSPAARMRAFDWLSARGLAPARYDPLATPKERRAALTAAAEAAAAQAAEAAEAEAAKAAAARKEPTS
jgi:hypothetical protein